MSGVKIEINTVQLSKILNQAMKTLANPKSMFAEMGKNYYQFTASAFFNSSRLMARPGSL